MGKKVWIQVDEDELEMMDDAGITVTQVNFEQHTSAQMLSITKAYTEQALCVPSVQLYSMARVAGARVGQEWEAGLLRLGKATQERLGWQARSSRVGVDIAGIQIFMDESVAPGGADFRADFEKTLDRWCKYGKVTAEAFAKLAATSAQADASMVKLKAVLKSYGRYDPVQEAWDLRGMSVDDLRKEGVLPTPLDRAGLMRDMMRDFGSSGFGPRDFTRITGLE